MRFNDFIDNNQVRKAQKDIALASSLVKTAEVDMQFVSALDINEISARKILTNYYDVLRSILEAIAAKDGFKVYSHEAFVYFLKEKDEPIIAEKFDRFRRIRNGINYYGKLIAVDEVKTHVNEIAKAVDILKKKYLERL